MKGDPQEQKHDQLDKLDMVEPGGPRVRSSALCGSEKLHAISAGLAVSPMSELDHQA